MGPVIAEGPSSSNDSVSAGGEEVLGLFWRLEFDASPMCSAMCEDSSICGFWAQHQALGTAQVKSLCLYPLGSQSSDG